MSMYQSLSHHIAAREGAMFDITAVRNVLRLSLTGVVEMIDLDKTRNEIGLAKG